MNPKCRKCWWREGNRCYCSKREFARDKDGRSSLPASGDCPDECFRGKREVLEQYILPEMLIILSELK
jgi:hypothetical protein